MINPDLADIGRKVVYRPRFHGAVPEEGVITSFNETCVFVRYGADVHSKGADRRDLEWVHP